MISRRRLLTGAGALGVGPLLVGCEAAATGRWRELPVGGKVVINGNSYEAECGKRTPALQVSELQTVRFTMLPGNGWIKDNPRGSERTELDGWRQRYPARVPLWISWSIYYEPGPWSTSDWCFLRQLYPWGGLILKPGGILHWLGPVIGDPAGDWPTRHSTQLAQGVWINFLEHVMLDPEAGTGFWRCWLNGKQVLDMAGPLGSRGVQDYWIKFGIYRGKWQRGGAPVTETISVRYANLRFGRADLSHLIGKPDPEPIWEI